MTVRIGSRPWFVGFVTGMASYIDAAAIVSFGLMITIYAAVFRFTPDQVGITSAVLTLGVAVGALIGGRLADRLGRRPVFTATMVIVVVGALVLAFGSGYPVIVLGAALVGLGTGGDLPVSLSTMSEAATDANRGKIIVFSNILWTAGIVVSAILGTVVGTLGRLGGQILFIHIAGVAVAVLIARLTIPESRIWKTAQAERRSGVETIRADRSRVRDLFRAPYLVPALALVVFYSLVNLGFNTFGQFDTYLLVNVAHIGVSLASGLGLVVLPLAVAANIWFMRIVNRPSRIFYFSIGALVLVASMLVLAIFGFTLITYLISVALLTVGGTFAGEPIMKVWTQEKFPTLIRTTAQGTIISVARFVAAAGAAVSPSIAALGTTYLFGALAVVCAIGSAVAWIVFRSRDQVNNFHIEGVADTDMQPNADRDSIAE